MDIKNTDSIFVDGHECVDLGLSVKWATCNIGAATPFDFGDYFAWAEINPVPDYRARFCKSWGKLLPFIGGNAALDTATAHWGENWRMPSGAEIDEIVDKCQWQWTNENGVNGCRVTGPNGNSVFFPAAGYMIGTELKYAGLYGHCWSSTPNEFCKNSAYILYWGDGNVYRLWNFRYFGRTVRAVTR